ncbi:MAG: hypothetical protein DI556_05205 [Rhodovulum sulfidophilum]|uniref:Lipoprotein n=1 Tax=Rhodovulum sulfidophilum TaxID=35806 RepID=A0A2W5NEG9_RHOSU|nr:MAG: hypothetical protein DI556_05205 [Rhodovulum sulfidophilum]
MRRYLSGVIAGLLCLTAHSAARADETSGKIVLGPPTDVVIEVGTGPEGEPTLADTEIPLALGGYYRVNLVCPEAAAEAGGLHVEADELLANSHLRVLSVGGMEFYVQGLTFRAIECDEAGTARFSFHPMRPGVYDLRVRDQSEPPREVVASVIVE